VVVVVSAGIEPATQGFPVIYALAISSLL